MAAEKRQQNVAYALRDELLVGVERLVFRAGSRSTAQKAFNHAERCNRHNGRDEVFQYVKVQAAEVKAVSEHQRARNVAHRRNGIHTEQGGNDRCQNDAHKRARHACAPLFRPDNHHDNDKQTNQHRLEVRMKAEARVRRDFCQIRAALGRSAEEIIDLPHRDNNRNAGRKAHDDGHRDEADEPPKLKNTG